MITDRVGVQHYSDCYHRPNEAWMSCVTWADHVSLLSLFPAESAGTDLDRESVERLVGQLQDWLDK